MSYMVELLAVDDPRDRPQVVDQAEVSWPLPAVIDWAVDMYRSFGPAATAVRILEKGRREVFRHPSADA